MVTFPRSDEALVKVLPDHLITELKPDELKAYEIFREKRILTKSDFAELKGLPDRTAERLLKRFVDLGLILKQGSGPATKYQINE